MLQGDIGEFLMHYLVSEYINDDMFAKYLYPKLVFKTDSDSAVHGNDGTIYIPEKNEIFYLESKFYKDLNSAIRSGISSLKEHNETKKKISIVPQNFLGIFKIKILVKSLKSQKMSMKT